MKHQLRSRELAIEIDTDASRQTEHLHALRPLTPRDSAVEEKRLKRQCSFLPWFFLFQKSYIHGSRVDKIWMTK